MTIFSQSSFVTASNNSYLPPSNSYIFTKTDHFISVDKQTSQVSLRTKEFIEGIDRKIFKSPEIKDVKALKEVIWLVKKTGVSPIQDALLKKSGYLSRWFSNEGWEEWTENRTYLGRVVGLYSDYVTSSDGLGPYLKRLDKKIIKVANKEARAILKSLKTSKESYQKPKKNSAPSFWSSFLSLPTAEGSSIPKAHFPPFVKLSSLNGTNGFKLIGEHANDISGSVINVLGDINGDGIDDFIIGAHNASPEGKQQAGKSYVIFGNNQGWKTPFELSSLNGVNGFVLHGAHHGDGSGSSVGNAGDINGDGINDFFVGAPFANYQGIDASDGKTYVIFGSKQSWSSPFELSSLNGNNGFFILGEQSDDSDYSGAAVSNIGDINGDGITDLLIGAPGTPGYHKGKSYVVFGSNQGWSNPFSLSSLNGVNGFIIKGGSPGDNSGNSVSGIGDINGDGLNDFIIGAYQASVGNRTNAGKSYVIFGSNQPWVSPFLLSSLNGLNGFTLYGESSGDNSGSSVSGVGDINGDKINDFIIGAYPASKSYVIFGKKNMKQKFIDLSSLNGTNGFILKGENDATGSSVSGGFDINNDGIDDLFIGAPGGSPNQKNSAGNSYVVFGNRKSWKSPVELSNLNGNNGFTLEGENENDLAGSWVSGGGDVNNDGFDDLFIGAPYALKYTGKSYVVFGKKSLK